MNPILTPRQQQILDLVRRSIERTGAPPTRAEIAEIAWIRPQAPFPVAVAPLSAEHILPAWRARGD